MEVIPWIVLSLIIAALVIRWYARFNERQAERGLPLEAILNHRIMDGWKVESQTTTTARVTKGRPVNHLLHVVLSFLTLGFWIPVWILIAAFGGERMEIVSGTRNEA